MSLLMRRHSNKLELHISSPFYIHLLQVLHLSQEGRVDKQTQQAFIQINSLIWRANLVCFVFVVCVRVYRRTLHRL